MVCGEGRERRKRGLARALGVVESTPTSLTQCLLLFLDPSLPFLPLLNDLEHSCSSESTANPYVYRINICSFLLSHPTCRNVLHLSISLSCPIQPFCTTVSFRLFPTPHLKFSRLGFLCRILRIRALGQHLSPTPPQITGSGFCCGSEGRAEEKRAEEKGAEEIIGVFGQVERGWHPGFIHALIC